MLVSLSISVIKDKVPQKKKGEKKAKRQKLGGSMPALWSHDLEANQDGSVVDSGAEEEGSLMM